MMKVFAFAFFFLLLPSAYAVPVLWNVDADTTFFDGTHVTGSFLWDSDADTVTEVSLSTEAGFMVLCGDIPPDTGACESGFPPETLVDPYFYDLAVPCCPVDSLPANPSLFAFSFADFNEDGDIDRALFLAFGGVDLVGGTVAMFITEWFCVNGDCVFDIENTVHRSGEGSVTAVPEPGTLGLLGIGLLGLAFARRKKAA